MEKVLVVDDEKDVLDILKMDLSDAGYQPLVASNAHEALAILKQNPKITAIVSDVRMPESDGKYLLEQLQKLHPHIHNIIMMTGFSEYPAEELKKLGAKIVLDKPIVIEQLIKLIRRDS